MNLFVDLIYMERPQELKDAKELKAENARLKAERGRDKTEIATLKAERGRDKTEIARLKLAAVVSPPRPAEEAEAARQASYEAVRKAAAAAREERGA